MARVPTVAQTGFGQTRTEAVVTPTQSLNTNVDMFGGSQARVQSQFAQGLDSLSEAATQAQQRVRQREEIILRRRDQRAFSERSAQLLTEFQTAHDPTDPDALAQFQLQMDQLEQETLEGHQGSVESQGLLTDTIMGITSQTRAAGVTTATQAQRALVMEEWQSEVQAGTAMVLQDPGQLNAAMLQITTAMQKDFAPALTPEEEMAQLDAARQSLIMSSINSFVARGQFDEANELITDNPVAFEMLDTASQTRVRLSIEDGLRQQNAANTEMTNRIAAVEVATGMQLTPAQRYQVATGFGLDRSPEVVGREMADVLGINWSEADAATRYALSNGLPPPQDQYTPATAAGQFLRDRQYFVDTYGEGSSEVAMFDQTSQASAQEFDPNTEVGKLIADRDQLIRQGGHYNAETGEMSAELLSIQRQINELDPEYQKREELRVSFRPAYTALRNFESEVQTVEREINSIFSAYFGQPISSMDDIGAIMQQNGFEFETTGLTAAFMRNLPMETDAGTIEAHLESLRAIIGFNALAAMREASPTGGALGQVSNSENRLLQSIQGALDINQPTALTQTLLQIRQDMFAVLEEKRAAFESDYASILQPVQTSSESNTSVGTGPDPSPAVDQAENASDTGTTGDPRRVTTIADIQADADAMDNGGTEAFQEQFGHLISGAPEASELTVDNTAELTLEQLIEIDLSAIEDPEVLAAIAQRMREVTNGQ